MIVFLLSALAMVVLALGMLLPTLLRRRPVAVAAQATVDAARASVQVLREQLAALDAERVQSAMDDAQYRQARAEIERRALEEGQGAGSVPAPARRSVLTALAIGVFVPVFAALLYLALGSPRAVEQALAGAARGEPTQAQIEAMVDGLAKRLESRTTAQEGDLQGWTMLANSYAALQRYPQASKAYARARALAPDNAQLLVDHADVLAMMQGQSIEGEPGRLIMRALQLDPDNLKALVMAGSWAFERRDFAGAIKFWTRAQPFAPPGSELASSLASGLERARAAAAPTSAPVSGNDAAAPARDTRPVTPLLAHVSGEVQVTDALARRVRPTDTVFVFAQALDGTRMPLAIVKRSAGELPFTFTLDDSSAMGPQARLSGQRQVLIGARVSRSGDAAPHSGDLTGQIGPVDVGSGKLVLMIDGVVP